MTPNLTAEQEVWRAERAKQLLEEPLIKEALQEMETQALDGLQNCPIKDVELRDRLWMLFCMTRMFKRNLESVMAGGEIALADIRQKTAWQKAKEAIGI